MVVEADSKELARRSTGLGVDPPRHVGIIMDGNGRWAAARGLPRSEGHRRGVEAVRATVRSASDLGIEVLTLFCFSSENWSRPAPEVEFLLGLLRFFIRKDLAQLNEAGVRILVIGERTGLPGDLAKLLTEAEDLTRANDALRLVIAFNYGGRDEIVRAVRHIASEAVDGLIDPAAITAKDIADRLDTAGLPDPDVIIRTSGELRLSNFLLWQSAYAELIFLPIYWPDFDRAAFEAAIREYGERDRRFGGLARGV
jgi:undecaprenyl diphosphate synthase